MSGSRALLVFAKTPKPGKVKTRLLELGVRMENAFRKCFAMGYREVVVIGTDTPWMGAERVRKAFSELKANDVVIGPAEDGGYYLLGMQKFVPEVFRGIPWSTERVLELTLKVVERGKLRGKLLRRDFDLDRPEDLKRAGRILKRRPRVAPALAAAIGRTWN